MKKIRKIAYYIHLWLGAISGAIMFVVCITGAIWAIGLHNWFGTDPKPEVIESNGREILAPSQLVEQLSDTIQNSVPFSIAYAKGAPATVRVLNGESNLWLTINPYTADVLSYVDYNKPRGEYKMTFFDYMRWGHRALWLPWDFGRKVVNYGTLIFLMVLVSGIIIWIPKSIKGFRNRVFFNWKKGVKLRRKLYDLHLIFGFYSAFFLIVICCTGLIWGLNWWSNGFYKITTGEDLSKQVAIESSLDLQSYTDTFKVMENIDRVFYTMSVAYPVAEKITLTFPSLDKPKSTIGVRITHDSSVMYNYDSYYYDKYSLAEVKIPGYQHGKYADKRFGEKLRRQNYDLHVGSVWGTVGEVLMFFAALFGASLPITGYYILFVVKQKRKKKR